MDSRHFDRLQDLFCAALDLPEAERDAFLARLPPGDAALRAEVASMLAAHADTGALRVESVILAAPAPPGAFLEPSFHEEDQERAGTRVGPWRLRRLLGRGGMGEVWLAERDDGAYAQRAAIKLVHSGWRRAELVRRFERERQLLARLEHPHIARLLDGGTTDDGVPYLAMEFVDGQPITAWCDERTLPVAARLRLFRTVCDAVRFAHANLVVHRDLKPANILVTAEGRPVLLDFGIARLLDPTDATGGLTRHDERLLTPDCAAPEQLRGEAVTTATDVWALGVLLYELLVGVRPFGGTGATALEIEKRVLHDEPARPAEAARAAAGAAEGDPARRAARRATTPEALARQLRGDLEPIVLTALRKEPERRYRSAEELGEDVAAWLAGRPVRAQPDSFRYRAGKYLRRNPLPVALVTLALVSLSLFAWLMGAQAQRVARERDRARAEEAKSERVLSMLVDLFEVSNPAVHPGGDTLRVGDLVRIAETRIPTLSDQPEVEARLWGTIATIHDSRSRPADAREAVRKGLAVAEAAHLDERAIELRHRLAVLTWRLDGAAAGQPLLRASLAEYQRHFGAGKLETTDAMQDLADCLAGTDEAMKLLDESLRVRQRLLPTGGVPLAATWNAIGIAAWGRGDFVKARDAFVTATALLKKVVAPTNANYLSTLQNAASCEGTLGNYAAAMRAHRELVGLHRGIFGPRSLGVAVNAMNVGLLHVHLSDFPAAVDSLRLSYDIFREIYGPDQFDAINASRNLAYPLLRLGQTEEAYARMDEALTWFRRSAGPNALETLFQELLNQGADVAIGRPVPIARAESLLVRYRELPPERSQNLPDILLHVAYLAMLPGDPAGLARAEAALDEALAALDGRYPDTQLTMATTRVLREYVRYRRHEEYDQALLRRLGPVVTSNGLTYPGLVEALRPVVGS